LGPTPESQFAQSRVIRIWGPVEAKLDSIIEELAKKVKFELVQQKEWTVAGGNTKVLELHFTSIVGQSRAIFKCFSIYKDMYDHFGEFSISYAPDPCDAWQRSCQNYPEWRRQ